MRDAPFCDIAAPEEEIICPEAPAICAVSLP
jgi:hypothetical protein